MWQPGIAQCKPTYSLDTQLKMHPYITYLMQKVQHSCCFPGSSGLSRGASGPTEHPHAPKERPGRRPGSHLERLRSVPGPLRTTPVAFGVAQKVAQRILEAPPGHPRMVPKEPPERKRQVLLKMLNPSRLSVEIGVWATQNRLKTGPGAPRMVSWSKFWRPRRVEVRSGRLGERLGDNFPGSETVVPVPPWV